MNLKLQDKMKFVNGTHRFRTGYIFKKTLVKKSLNYPKVKNSVKRFKTRF